MVFRRSFHSGGSVIVLAGFTAACASPLATSRAEKSPAARPSPAAVSRVAPRPSAPPLPVPADPALPSLFLIGDSTIRTGSGDGANGQWGWGEPLAAFFDARKINVVNRGLGGRSSRTYITQGHWACALELAKPGDWFLIQFGHNDGSPVNDAARARGTLPGVGEETQEIDNLLTLDHEVVHTYGRYLRRFIADIRARGATPIVCSLVPRKVWHDGRIARNENNYAQSARETAAAERVGFIDLNEIIACRYEELGPEKVEAFFADKDTHTTAEGARINAAAVVAGLKALDPCGLCAFLSAEGAAVRAVDRRG